MQMNQTEKQTGESKASRVGKQAIIPNRRDPIACNTIKEANEIVEAYNRELKRFRARYVNVAAINDQGGTISTQVWCASQEDIYDAERTLVKWCLPAEERWHGKVIFATIFDTATKQLRKFNRDGDALREVLS